MSEEHKFKFSFGNINIEYEGDLAELKSHLPDILECVSQFKPSVPPLPQNNAPSNASANAGIHANSNGALEATTHTIATKLGCKSGPDLIKATSVQLTLVQGKQKFSRDQINEEMKTSSYYKQTYTKNLSNYLGTLMKSGFLNEVQKDVYAVNPAQLQQLEANVA